MSGINTHDVSIMELVLHFNSKRIAEVALESLFNLKYDLSIFCLVGFV